MISPLPSLLTWLNWPAGHFPLPFVFVCLGGSLFVAFCCVFLLSVFLCFCLFCIGMVTAPWTMYRSSLAQLLWLSLNCLRQCIN